MSTALYRRYRPESFADVIGQEHVTGPLVQALRTGRVGHAYLFSGPRGCGKTTSARILARCLNCEQGPTPTPCGTCASCVALSRGGSGSIDVIEIDAASHGGVDDARDLRERASYGPAQSRYKIYIIDEAHMVSSQGFNALLKIVEEPPEHVKFVFATTEPEKVIGTIRSRTHHYPFRLVPPARLGDYLQQLCDQEGVRVAPGVLSFVTRAGGGSVRDSLSVLDQLIAGSGDEGLTYDYAVSLLGFTDGELLDATIDALAAGDGAAVFRQVDKVIESGHDPRRFVEDLLERLRDLIIVAAVPEGAGQVLRGVPVDQLERMQVQQAAFGPGALSRAADIVNTGLTEMTGATTPRLQLELICARILLPAASGEQGYAARLDRLERRLEVGGVPTTSRPTPARPTPAPSQGDTSASPGASSPTSRDGAHASGHSTGGVHGSGHSTGGASEASGPVPESGIPIRDGAPGDGEPADAPPPAAPAAAPPARSAGMDTDAIRRAWPDVLGRISSMRRVTWTFVAQHAQVLAYDGRTLTLGMSTQGLTNAFRQGNHAEVVRQALIDELGVDAVVDGITTPEAAPAADPAPRAHSAGGPEGPSRSSGGAEGRPGAEGGAALETNSGWGAVTSAAPDWATSGTAARPATAPAPDPAPQGAPDQTPQGAPDRPGKLEAVPTDGAPDHGRTARSGARAVRQSLGQARQVRGAPVDRPVGQLTDDSAVSDDDEDIEQPGDVGRVVIEKVLGGRVVAETED
ncbi:MAG TPA: DNA polymerase III subunit gamma and tau [Intrasporangium sp.]|uniref:DNA polymerase III subunit gamma and tau n=1 Tax=Intrasporangium sp. TaxID=1925024 RepID=UPI002D780F94|nr:DNA polymerase III subunit gamma and tau [Intrasporangium sp.]HET7400026.1 DNA polymerase III subunit gamma and tau [Intrasporangium sp.]